MDFQNAALLALLVFVLVEVVKRAVPAVAADGRFVLLSALVLGVAAAFVVAESAWGHEQIVGGKNLDALNAYSKVVVGIFLGAGAVGIDKVLGAVKSIGENQPE